MYKKYAHLREMIETCAVKFKNNVAFKLKKKDENKKEESTKNKISKIGKTIHDRPKEIEKREEIGH